MPETHPSRPPRLGRFRARVLSGLVVLVPLVVTLVVLRGILRFVAGITLPLFGTALQTWPPLAREALAAFVLLIGVYVLGEVATLVVGRRLIGLGERILLKVPLARLVYGASKQVLESFQTTRPNQFRSVVAIDFPQAGSQSIGFVTSTLGEDTDEPLITVFVPTTPNPTTGFLQIIPAAKAQKLDITVEDAIKTVMSLGVLAPNFLVDDLSERARTLRNAPSSNSLRDSSTP